MIKKKKQDEGRRKEIKIFLFYKFYKFYKFIKKFLLNWALNSFCSTTASPTSLVRSRIACSTGEIGCGG